MREKRKTVSSVFLLLGLVSISIGVSFAFFNYTRTGSANTIKTGRISFNTTQDGNISLTNIFPVSSEEIDNVLETGNNITINITGDTTYGQGIEYLVTAEDVNITVNEKKVPLNLYVTSTTSLGNNDEDYFDNRGGETSLYKVLSGGVVVDGQYLLVGYIAPGQSGVNGSLNIKAYIDKDKIAITDTPEENLEWQRGRTVFTTEEWNSIQGTGHELSFKVRVEANEGVWVDPYTTPNLMNTINFNRSAVNIKEIRFIEETPLRMQRRYDASVGSESNGTKGDLTFQDTGKVLAWIEPITTNPTGTNNELLNIKPKFLFNEENEKKIIEQIDNETNYILYIASSGETKWIYTGASNIFSGFSNVEKIYFENFDTSSVPIMNDMFKDLSKLTSVNVSALDTSGVYQMSEMFSGCTSLTSVDLSGLGSNNLGAISAMFYNCNALAEIIMKSFNFGHVNFNQSYNNYSNYYYAFAYLPNVETIDLTNANTSGVTNMYDMFYNCKKLKNIIGLNTLDTSNVTVMQYMFSECDALTSIDLSNLNINNVQSMGSMFYGCDNLENVTMHGNSNGSLTDLGSMFSNCPKLSSIDLTGLGGDNLNSYNNIFNGCTSLKNIDMSNFNFGKISSFDDSSSIFYPLKGVLENINLSRANFSGPNITTSSFYSFFDNFRKLKSVDLSYANTSKVTSMFNMFYADVMLENVNLTGIDTSNVTSMQAMFQSCWSLASLNLESFNTSKVTSMNSMFDGCQSLTSLNLKSFNTRGVTEMDRMFYGCKSITAIYVGNSWDLSNVITNSGGMFVNCTSLVGGNGTVFDSTKIDAIMAVIDTPSTPGYLTLAS